MRDPKRILQKILGKTADLQAYENSEEPLDLLVETLREVQRCRKHRHWLKDYTGIEAALPPHSFQKLLQIPEINFSETADRNLDVHQTSLLETRNPDDPVSVANLNTFLRELFKDLSNLNELKTKEHAQLRLVETMSGDLVERVSFYIQKLQQLDLRGVGYLLTGFNAKKIENQFQKLFPNANGVHPLRKHISKVQLELGFYHLCLELNIKWAVTGMDLFSILRKNLLHQVIQNTGELGNSIWNLVYNGMKLPTCLELVGIKFEDAQTIFDEHQVPLANA